MEEYDQYEERYNKSEEWFDFFYDFDCLKNLFSYPGLLASTVDWELRKPIQSLFFKHDHPTARFIMLIENEIGYQDYTEQMEKITVLGVVALVAFLLQIKPPQQIPKKKFYYMLRALNVLYKDDKITKILDTKRNKMIALLKVLNTEKNLQKKITRSFLFIEAFANSNTEEYFFISCRDLAALARLDNHVEGNRMLNLFCLLGYLEKQAEKKHFKLADRYKIAEDPFQLKPEFLKLSPLLSLNNLYKGYLLKQGFEAEQLDRIFRRLPEAEINPDLFRSTKPRKKKTTKRKR